MKQYRIVRRRGLLAFGLAAAFVTAPLSAPAQQRGTTEQKGGAGQKAQPAAAPKPAKPWSVRMSREAPHTFSVKAKEARLSDLAGEFSRLLKVPVKLSPLVEKQNVSVEFSGMNLEGAMRMLAPQVFVDYVASGNEPQPRPLAVYLQGVNERPPSLTETVKGSSEAILIEGDTEEGVGTANEQKKREEENPLRVTFAQNQLSVRARKQPLSVVLYRIAHEIGVPFELKWESAELVDVEFDNYSIEQAVRTLSPGVRLYYRIDLQSFGVQPLRLALVAPASGQS